MKINDRFGAELLGKPRFALYACDAGGLLTFYNKAVEELWGRVPEIGKDMWCHSWQLFFPDGTPCPREVNPMIRALMEQRVTEGQEMLIIGADGKQRNIIPYAIPLSDSSGTLTGAVNLLMDITGQKELEEQRAILAAIIESSEDAIVGKDLEGTITSWNKGAEHIFGYSQAEIIGRHISVLIPESHLYEEEMIMENIKMGRKTPHFQTFRVSKDKGLIPVSITISPIKNSQGRVIGASKIARNIAEQIKVQDLLQRNADNLATLNAIGKSIAEELDVQVILQRVIQETTAISGAESGAFLYHTYDLNGEVYTKFAMSGIAVQEFERSELMQTSGAFDAIFNDAAVLRYDDIRKDSSCNIMMSVFKEHPAHRPLRSYLAVPVLSGQNKIIGGLFFGHKEPGVFKAHHEDMMINIANLAAVALDNARLYEKVQILNARKDEFIAMAGHELKTPLTSVSGYLQVLEQNQANEVDKIFIGKARRQLKKLTNLVTELLDISRIEAGKLQFRYERFDFHQLLHDILESFQYLNNSHKIQVSSDARVIYLEADRQRIEQAIVNLISNAIKYSPEADRIVVMVQKTDEELILKIQDFGIGIPLQQQQHIFSKFFRAEELTNNIAGLGIGLYLTKEIIERHGGKVSMESVYQAGSTFTVQLPLMLR